MPRRRFAPGSKYAFSVIPQQPIGVELNGKRNRGPFAGVEPLEERARLGFQRPGSEGPF